MIGERLFLLRSEKGLTMKEVGESIGVTDAAYNKYEKGRSEPSIGTLINIANLFEVSLDYLLCRTEIRNFKIDDQVHISNRLVSHVEKSNYIDSYKIYEIMKKISDLMATMPQENQKSLDSLFSCINNLIDFCEAALTFDAPEILEAYNRQVVDIVNSLYEIAKNTHKNSSSS